MNDWYEIIENSNELEQGDFIYNCPVIYPPKNIKIEENQLIESDAEGILLDVVILSQSCDLKGKKINNVLVCPVYELNFFQEKFETFKHKKNLEQIRKGYQHSYHLLNECILDGFKSGFKIVEFKQPFSVDIKYLENFVSNQKRLRLKSPYKEHLSQAFARFFMRVGLPTDIPSFRK